MSATSSIFLRNPALYYRDLDILKNANEISADYLQLQTGQPWDKCYDYVVRATAPDGDFPIKELMMRVIVKDENGDRIKGIVSLSKTLKSVIANNDVYGPNMSCYHNTHKLVSCSAKYIALKRAERAGIKKRGILAEQARDMEVFFFCNNLEYAIKILVNSISGAMANNHNALYFKSGHNTLTSITRVIVSYANASTEKFLAGNRHYWSCDVVIENILATVRNMDLKAVDRLILTYGLYVPTVDDVVNDIKRCTKFYWKNKAWDLRIRSLLEKLSSLQLAAFLYSGNFYNLAMFNPALVKGMIKLAVTRPDYVLDGVDQIIKEADDSIIAMANIFCADVLNGETIYTIRSVSEEAYKIYGTTVDHLNKVVALYSDLLTGLFITDCIPSSIYEYPTSLRMAVGGSDTDSCMFTVQFWVIWYMGKLSFSSEANNVAEFVSYLNIAVIGHMLAMTSKQMGVCDDQLFVLTMKNEYTFPVYMRAMRAKHYIPVLSSREGLVYKMPKIVLMGVGLKDSKIPKLIMSRVKNEATNIVFTIMNGDKIGIYELMQKIANLEHMIYNSIKNGEVKYLSTANISNISSYKNPMSSKYMHYDCWVNVFERKYGSVGNPPYRTVKVNTTLGSATSIKKWLAVADPVIRDSLTEWVTVNRKDSLNMLLLPYEVFEAGIPEDFMDIVDVKTTTAELVSAFYIILEMLGMFVRTKNKTFLLMDDFTLKPEYGLPGDSPVKLISN